MTCIIGYQEENSCYMGVDSCSSDEDAEWISKISKIFVKDGLLFSFAGSFRMGQILRYRLKVPHTYNYSSKEEYMNTVFIDAVRICFEEGGFAHLVDGEETIGSFLVALGGEIFHVQEDLHVAQFVDGIYADGVGVDIARGFLMAEQQAGRSGLESMKSALETVGKTTSGVCGPYIVYKQDENGMSKECEKV